MAAAWRELPALWLRGAWASLQFQRGLALCLQDRRIARQCAKSTALNGCVFCGSLLYARCVLSPVVDGLLAWGLGAAAGQATARIAGSLILLIYDVLWILPVYCVSLLVSVAWCQDIADAALAGLEEREGGDPAERTEGTGGKKRPGRRGGEPDLLDRLSEKAYTVLLLGVFYVQVLLVGMLPRLGAPAAWLLLSWLWAYYCFDYVWAYHGLSLGRRLARFEHNWAFFSGFGSLCAAIAASCPPYAAAAISGLVFPILVLVACATDLRAVPGVVVADDRDAAAIGGMPIFGAAERSAHLIVDCVAGRVPAALALVRGVGGVVEFLRM